MDSFIKPKNRTKARNFLVGLLLTGCLLHFAPSILANTLYKWTDDQGQTHFTDNIDKVPEEYRNQVSTRELGLKPKPNKTAQGKNKSLLTLVMLVDGGEADSGLVRDIPDRRLVKVRVGKHLQYRLFQPLINFRIQFICHGTVSLSPFYYCLLQF